MVTVLISGMYLLFFFSFELYYCLMYYVFVLFAGHNLSCVPGTLHLLNGYKGYKKSKSHSCRSQWPRCLGAGLDRSDTWIVGSDPLKT
jgi:hypothetical protein